MFEKSHEHIAPFSTFLLRLFYSISIGLFLIAATLVIGIIGFRFYENMEWMDAYMNAAMTLADMGLVNPIATNGGKIFAGIYALFCGLIFISIMGVVFAPIIHRFFHVFHHNDRK
jgi:hypothetical protein